MIDTEPDLAIGFNGCIHNHMELRAELEAKVDRFLSCGDTVVILKARHARRENVLQGACTCCLRSPSGLPAVLRAEHILANLLKALNVNAAALPRIAWRYSAREQMPELIAPISHLRACITTLTRYNSRRSMRRRP
jgi:hypothetical protein